MRSLGHFSGHILVLFGIIDDTPLNFHRAETYPSSNCMLETHAGTKTDEFPDFRCPLARVCPLRLIAEIGNDRGASMEVRATEIAVSTFGNPFREKSNEFPSNYHRTFPSIIAGRHSSLVWITVTGFKDSKVN